MASKEVENIRKTCKGFQIVHGIIDLYFALKCSFQYFSQGNQGKNGENNSDKINKRTKIKGIDREKS